MGDHTKLVNKEQRWRHTLDSTCMSLSVRRPDLTKTQKKQGRTDGTRGNTH